MNEFWAALGSLAGWLAFTVLVVAVIAVGVSWAVIKLVERRLRDWPGSQGGGGARRGGR